MIITIDGPAGVGKTTVGKLTANKLGIGFLDTGIMYRALTWFLLENNLEDSSINKIHIHLENLTFDLDIRNVDTTTILINKNNVTDLLNSPQVEKYVSKISFANVYEICSSVSISIIQSDLHFSIPKFLRSPSYSQDPE